MIITLISTVVTAISTPAVDMFNIYSVVLVLALLTPGSLAKVIQSFYTEANVDIPQTPEEELQTQLFIIVGIFGGVSLILCLMVLGLSYTITKYSVSD